MRALRILGWTMIWSGGLIVAFLVYQLFGTGLITARAQGQAEAEFAARVAAVREEPTTSTPEPTVPSVPSSQPTVEIPTLLAETPPEIGGPVGKITIPSIGLENVLLEGVDRSTLKGGPGHMPWTPLPGQPGNTVISGHRTTYGAPFFDLDQVAPGDLITVETLRGTHVYAIREVRIVAPTDVWVTDPRPGAWVTLTTCNPKFSARQRLVVMAEMIGGPNFAYIQAQRELQTAPAT